MNNRELLNQELTEFFTNQGISIKSDIITYLINKKTQPQDDIKTIYQQIKKDNPSELAVFRAKSRPYLEAAAVRAVKESVTIALKTMMSMTFPAKTFSSNEILQYLFTIRGMMASRDEFPGVYPKMIEMADRIKNMLTFLDGPTQSDYAQLIQELNDVTTTLTSFDRHQRYKSKTAVEAFFKQRAALADNTFEIALLNIAGINQGTTCHILFQKSSDTSRIVIELHDLSTTNEDKLVKYLLSVGDNTAYLDKDRDLHVIEVDGELFQQCVLPGLTNIIKADATPLKPFSTTDFPGWKPGSFFSKLGTAEQEEAKEEEKEEGEDKMILDQ